MQPRLQWSFFFWNALLFCYEMQVLDSKCVFRVPKARIGGINCCGYKRRLKRSGKSCSCLLLMRHKKVPSYQTQYINGYKNRRFNNIDKQESAIVRACACALRILSFLWLISNWWHRACPMWQMGHSLRQICHVLSHQGSAHHNNSVLWFMRTQAQAWSSSKVCWSWSIIVEGMALTCNQCGGGDGASRNVSFCRVGSSIMQLSVA